MYIENKKNKDAVLFKPNDYKKLRKILDKEYQKYIKTNKKFNKDYLNSNINLRKKFIDDYQKVILKNL